MTTFIELHNSQNYSTITPQQALQIMQDHLSTYKEGERFKRSFQVTRTELEKIYGKKINKRKEAPAETTYNNKVTGTVTQNKKYRYIQTDIEKEITPLSFLAKGIYLNLLTSHDTNSLGIFKYNLNAKAGYLGISIDLLIKGLQELQEAGYARYIDGYIIHNHFLAQQKSSGNDDNKRGAVKLYNALPNNIKLPFIESLDLTIATPQQVNELYDKLTIAIPLFGILVSEVELPNNFIFEIEKVYTSELREKILDNGYTSLNDTTPAIDWRANFTAPVITIKETNNNYLQVEASVTQIEVTQVEEVSSLNESQTISQPVEVINSEDEFERILQDIEKAPQQVRPHQVNKLNDDEIIDIIIECCELPIDSKDTLRVMINDNAFNTLYRLVACGARDSETINEQFRIAMEQWGVNQRNSA